MAEGNCIVLRSRTHIPSRMKAGETDQMVITIANYGDDDDCYMILWVNEQQIYTWQDTLEEGNGVEFNFDFTVNTEESTSIELRVETGHIVGEGVHPDDMLTQWIYIEVPKTDLTKYLAGGALLVGIAAVGAAVYRGGNYG